LQNNKIGDDGARFIAEALKSNQSLTTLNLSVSITEMKISPTLIDIAE